MTDWTNRKVTPTHLNRQAFLYAHQSIPSLFKLAAAARSGLVAAFAELLVAALITQEAS